MKNIKVVLISEAGYSKKYDELLISFLDQGYELFSVTGKECELWEEIMDVLAVGNGTNSRYITTTSHPDETEEQVIEFAKNFGTSKASGIQVVRI